MHVLANAVVTDSTAIAALITAITGLVAAVGTALALVLSHRNMSGRVSAVKETVEEIQNGSDTHDGPSTGSTAPNPTTGG